MVSNVVKRYGAFEALKGVSLTVPSNSVFCILGPNGAGKTTLLRILSTISRPDSGQVSVMGHDLATDVLGARQHIGIVAQDNQFDRYLSIWHNLTMHAQMHGIPKPQYEADITALLKSAGLYERRLNTPDTLSGGMKRRVSLIRAMIHKPSVLFLDEPTTGLDPQARRGLWEAILEFKKQATVILTTHYMEEAEVLSDNILLLSQGQVVKTGTSSQLKRALSPVDTYELVLDEAIAEALSHTLSAIAGVNDCTVLDPFRLKLALSSANQLPLIMQALDPHRLVKLGRLEVDLEAVFMTLPHDHE
jgi:ABC-2 type transport system ATP-binding protein